jgi:ankyrin repeat protein
VTLEVRTRPYLRTCARIWKPNGCRHLLVNSEYEVYIIVGFTLTTYMQETFCKILNIDNSWKATMFIFKTAKPYPSMSAHERNELRDKLFQAIEKGNLRKVKGLIKQDFDLESTTRIGGNTALHHACWYGQLEIVQYLIETCHVDTESKGVHEWTALFVAIKEGHSDIVRYLIDTCHVNTEAKDNVGNTPLHIASREGRIKIVKYLIETSHVNIDAKNNDGWTALLHASYNGHLDTVQYLIETCHADTNAKTTSDGRDALHHASSSGSCLVVRYLIEACHLDPQVADHDGRTAADLALKSCWRNVLLYLNAVKADVPCTKDHEDSGEVSSHAAKVDMPCTKEHGDSGEVSSQTASNSTLTSSSVTVNTTSDVSSSSNLVILQQQAAKIQQQEQVIQQLHEKIARLETPPQTL